MQVITAYIHWHHQTPPDMQETPPDTTRHNPDTTRHHQTMSDRLAVVLWWFTELYSWSRFFLPTNERTDGRTDERTDKGIPRGPRGPKNKVFSIWCKGQTTTTTKTKVFPLGANATTTKIEVFIRGTNGTISLLFATKTPSLFLSTNYFHKTPLFLFQQLDREARKKNN